MTDFQESLIQAGSILVVATVGYLLIRMSGERFMRRLDGKDHESRARAITLWKVLKRVTAVGIFFLALLLIMNVAFGINLGAFLAVGTVVGAALGFGAQHLVRDLLAGFFILAENQYHVGDTIRIADTEGTVQDIQFRVTVLRDYEGNVHYVPNGAITVASNYTSVFAKPVVDIGVAYDTDIDRAMEVMRDEMTKLAADPDWSAMIKGDVEVLGVQLLDDSAVVLRGRLTTTADDRWKVRRELLRRLKNRFDAEGIVIPFPQVSVHQSSD